MPVAQGPSHLVESDHMERLMSHIFRITRGVSGDNPSQLPTAYEPQEKKVEVYSKKRAVSSESINSRPIHRSTPVDRFFESFTSIPYDPCLPPSTSYKNLEKHLKPSRGTPKSKEIWDRYQKALRAEFDLWYGADDDLTAWHAFCRAIGINPLPETCKNCEKVKFRLITLVQT